MRAYDYDRISPEDLEMVLRRGSTSMSSALGAVRPIVGAVRAKGDRALLAFARKYEGFTGSSVKVPPEEIRAASDRIPPPLMKALKLSMRRIQAYHRRQRIGEFEFKDSCGTFGQRVVPIERVGIYVPGGTAAYASSVLMSAIPAKVAGVSEIAMCTPSRNGRVRDAVLAAAQLAGVDEIYSVGGAQAIAALAYGTETVRPVLKIVGPGGTIVSAAKVAVRQDCEIDSVAGPSEVLIIADGSAKPAFVAGEMAAQLEHDPSSVAVLVSPSKTLIDRAQKALARMIEQSDRKSVMERSSVRGAVFMKVGSMSKALEFSDMYAPEHLVIDTKSPKGALPSVRNAGSVFLGPSSSVAFGDYCSGPNHVLPTMGTARARSGLSVYDFLKVLPYQQLTQKGAATLAPMAALMAESEGLPNHAEAARMRLEGDR